MRYGLPLGLFFMGMTILFYLIDMDTEKWTGFLAWSIMLVISFYFVYDARKLQNGQITFKEGFKVAFFALFFATVINTIYLYLHIEYINTHFLETLMEKEKAAMLSKGISEETVAKNMALVAPFNSPLVSVLSPFVINTVLSAVIGVVSAAVMKKD